MHFRPHETSLFFNFTQIVFWDSQKADTEFSVPFDHMNRRFLDLAKVAFWACEKADIPVCRNHVTSLYRLQPGRILWTPEDRNEFLGLFHNFKYHFIDFTTVAFCDIQKADNEFPGPFDH
jgi:hypothetical protein